MKINFKEITIKMLGDPCYNDVENAIDSIIYTLEPFNTNQCVKDLIAVEIRYVNYDEKIKSFVEITIKPIN